MPGAEALPIVTLISVLGRHDPWPSSAQRSWPCSAPQIYVANLVAIGDAARDGLDDDGHHHGRPHRRGVSPPQLGTMQVNEEIDALATLGISPIEFLVLPRAARAVR